MKKVLKKMTKEKRKFVKRKCEYPFELKCIMKEPDEYQCSRCQSFVCEYSQYNYDYPDDEYPDDEGV